MTIALPFDLNLASEAATSTFAQALAPLLGVGDVLCLSGPIGAGKSHFARQVVRTRLHAVGKEEDIPSPTFTLVQTYKAGALEIWHADLYRLGDVQEIIELGLDDAFEDALCLIEWPDRLGEDVPDRALHIELSTLDTPDARRMRLRSDAPEIWSDRITAALEDMKGRI
ncbi:tRNA (adenosine(37)-N6)-threonylcarbamoyltransferase complex ATPase subunit type 1 TsaE [Qingshengfaniella alkalisoli]|uniref:tRNA threonylcarbamoyladenosine biosynthesis protein TsaE n=1 Tax=Qingshengfaniella alkalisoli TaxID=2599296 RepID=A0A5B8J6A5_9RHOB|nr:tRNA (adenosine(37)-N6)-threonylcarbamoyltransferase complex ATPase subunit type 1 TsaE [Qingshengfaniella alkalisoli]QDY69967.1 tRNA (adenosine(37)-N6)-threonylcarbamoyltransferase complex ATPase subunit type 1 TsaE [Qingshengfaniella alkalisoli]